MITASNPGVLGSQNLDVAIELVHPMLWFLCAIFGPQQIPPPVLGAELVQDLGANSLRYFSVSSHAAGKIGIKGTRG